MIWHQQAHETPEAWEAFVWFLDSPKPRNLPGICAAHNGKLEIWRNWAEGRDKRGSRIGVAQTWEQRAAAYDAWSQSAQAGELLDEMLRDELKDYRAQLAKWREVWERAQLHQQKRVTHRATETGDMEVVLVQMNVKDWLLLSQWRREIGAQGRDAIKRGR